MTSSSIPDGISFEDLEGLASQAAAREEIDNVSDDSDKLSCGYTREEILNVAEKHCTAALEDINDPLVHKAMCVLMLNNMLEWHSKAGMNQDSPVAQMCWHRDAGKFQAILNILDTISVGEEDFLRK